MGATLRRVERPLRRRLNASVSSAGRWLRVAGRWSRVDGRGSRVDSRRSMVDGRRSRVVDRGLRVTGRDSVARAPNSRRAERLLRGRSGGVARLPCRQRHSDHHRFRCMVPCRSARIVEIGGSPVRVNWKTTHSVARSLAHVQGAFRACERCVFFSCERGATSRGLISCTQTLNLERRFVFWALRYIARDAYCIDVRSLPCR